MPEDHYENINGAALNFVTLEAQRPVELAIAGHTLAICSLGLETLSCERCAQVTMLSKNENLYLYSQRERREKKSITDSV